MSSVPASQQPGEQELIHVDQVHGDDVFGEVATSSKYLPRLQMFGGNSDPVKAGKVPMANYALVPSKDNFVVLGPRVDCIPLAWRPKAMDVGGEEILTVFDHKSPEFARIQAASEIKDSGCMFGPEFLVWLPGLHKFCLLFMSNKTARREAPAIRERLGKPTTLATEFIKTKKYSWHGIVCQPCSTPFDLPEDEAVDEETEKFQNPPASEIEREPEDPAGAAARVR